jgi:hypothetical protein
MAEARTVADRIADGMVAAWLARVSHLEGHAVLEHDGIVVALSGLPDPELSVALVAREPADPLGALARAAWWFRMHGMPLGVDVERGRHPAVDHAVETMGLARVVSRPAMAVEVSRVEPPERHPGLELHHVVDASELRSMAALETASFGTAPAVAERIFAPSALARDDVSLYLATFEGAPVAMAYVHAHERALGVFGVATAPAFRRRGFGTAITAFAIHDGGQADLAWLQPSEVGVPVYAAMGFEPVATWDVWVRRDR